MLHTFTGGADGANPQTALAIDRGGNLYGTTYVGGLYGSGTVFKLAHVNAGWVLAPLYEFSGSDGAGVAGGVIFGPDGSLYGTTLGGGAHNNGTVFRLQPPPTPCRSTLCYWRETILYNFAGFPDGSRPIGNLAFDLAGNIYGVTQTGGANTFGTVFKLTHQGGAWTESVLYSFMGGQDGSQPVDGVAVDNAGNLFGTTRFGGVNNCSSGCGTVFELSPSGSGWAEHVLYRFTGPPDGYQPYGGVVLDPAGNVFGATFDGGQGGSGVIFELSPSGGTWNYSVLYNVTGNGGGPWARLTRDAGGNLYGTTIFPGSVFKLSPSGGHWVYTDLHDFTLNDGSYAKGSVVLDSQGRIYGTSSEGGADQYGTAWEVAP